LRFWVEGSKLKAEGSKVQGEKAQSYPQITQIKKQKNK
jgi:hypothetical protein